jgi:hypothetical protein
LFLLVSAAMPPTALVTWAQQPVPQQVLWPWVQAQELLVQPA